MIRMKTSILNTIYYNLTQPLTRITLTAFLWIEVGAQGEKQRDELGGPPNNPGKKYRGSVQGSSHGEMVRFLICTKGRINRISWLTNMGYERKNNQSCFGLSKWKTQEQRKFWGWVKYWEFSVGHINWQDVNSYILNFIIKDLKFNTRTTWLFFFISTLFFYSRHLQKVTETIILT